MDYKFYSMKSPKKGYSWETAPAPVPEAQITETLEAEVITIGGGISGLAAAARCANQGLSGIVIDKNEKLVALAGQIAAINSRWMAEKDIKIDKKQLAADWLKVSGSRVEEELLWIFINRSAEGFEWMIDLTEGTVDVGIYASYLGPMFNEYPGTHHINKIEGTDKYTYRGGGYLACEILEQEFVKQGGLVFRGVTAKYLEKDETGRIVSCVAQGADGVYRRYVGKKAVVLATGDCSDNREMMEAFCPIGLRTSREIPRKGNTGDGQMMAFWAGAALDNPEWAPTLHALSFSGQQFFFLHVNQIGRRFMNEDTWLQAKSVRCMMQPGGDFAYSVFDSKWLDEIEERWDIIGGQGMSPLHMLGETINREQVQNSVQAAIEGRNPFGGGGNSMMPESVNGFVADTIEELAEKIDVPVETLVKTVARYNEVCAAGDDTDFGKRTELLTSITKPPFIALKWGPALLDVFGGTMTNVQLNAMSSEAEPIPGLYAVGNAAGGMYAVDYPLLLNGNSYGRALAYAMQLADSLNGKI